MSLRYVLYDLAGLFENENDREISEDGLLWFLESLCQWNQKYLKRHPETPRLYDSGVVYKLPEQMVDGDSADSDMEHGIFRHGEHFRDIPAIIQNGGGDCDNVSAWRVAELRNAGYKGVMPYITNRERAEGGRTYHALVWWPYPSPKGSTEDPSLLLGMGGPEREAERQEERRKNAERVQLRDNKIKIGLRTGRIAPQVAMGLAMKARREKIGRGR